MGATMKAILSTLLAALALVPAAQAERPVLIELFASQNCKVCPQAYKTLRAVEKAHEGEVFILTWAVDYWDYLGEPDPLAIPAATERQAAYADRLGVRAPYTPQSVYDGAKECPATKEETINANIDDRRKVADTLDIEVSAGDGKRFAVDGALPAPADIHLVSYVPEEDAFNGMVNPVVSTRKLGVWTGGPVTFSYTCERACAVIVQERGFGQVLAARPLQARPD